MQPLNNNTDYNTINSNLNIENNTQAQISNNPTLNVNIPEILVKDRNIANTPSNVSFSQRDDYPQLSKNSNLEEVINFWQVISNNKDNFKVKDLTVKESQNLHDFLYNLYDLTSRPHWINTREFFANSVINILKIITTNSTIKEDVFLTLNNISTLITSKTEDKVFIFFLELKLLFSLFNAEKQTNKDVLESSLLNMTEQQLTLEGLTVNPSKSAKLNSPNLNKPTITYLLKLLQDFSLSTTVENISSNQDIFNKSKEDIKLAYEEVKKYYCDKFVRDNIRDCF